jgi:glycosyltransferase involved in cell wall biosynthesis
VVAQIAPATIAKTLTKWANRDGVDHMGWCGDLLLLAKITPVVLTYNEEANIGRCLERLFWAQRIVVADGESNDATVEICDRFPTVRVYQRAFDCHANQWNFAIHQTDIDTDWVLALDADYLVSKKFVEELANLEPPASVTGYRAGFDYTIAGKRLRCSLYPPVTVLFRRKHGRYVQDGHTQRIVIDGEIVRLHSRLEHDDRKPIDRWLTSQIAYARLEAEKLFKSAEPPTLPDRFRTMIPLSWLLVPTYLLVVKRGLLDGTAGWFYALQRGIAEALICLSYLERRLEIRGRVARNQTSQPLQPEMKSQKSVVSSLSEANSRGDKN